MRTAAISRKTKETQIEVRLNLDGTGRCAVHTGIGFFDHMLEQIARHGLMDLDVARLASRRRWVSMTSRNARA